MYNILVVEDEINILKLMQIRLSKSGFNVFTAENGKQALDIINKNNIQLIIADLMMPVMDGFELVEKVRSNNNSTPIIIATAKEDINDKSLAFSIGADDYMVKPINHEELVLRIHAILKRAKITEEKILQFNETVIDFNTLKVSNSTNSVLLTRKEFDLLYKLLENPRHLFSKSELLDDCWGYNSESYEETLKVHINRIRKKIEPFTNIDIETVRGVGYKGVVRDD